MGHEKSTCYRLMKCDHCQVLGHPTQACRTFANKMVELRRKAQSGELTAEEVLELLN